MNFFSQTSNIQVIESLRKKNYAKRLCQFLLGCFIIAIAFNLFIASNDLVPGGVGGIAVILKNLFGFDNSITILVINIFLLILSFILLGVEKTRSTILGTILFPILIKLTENANVWIKFDTSKILLMAIMGGALYGIGAGLVFKAGFTTGGTDIINQILAKYGKMSMGRAMLMSDGLIVILSGVFFGLPSMLYSIMILYMISVISDRIVLGISDNKMFYIVTKQEDEMKEFILKELNHGATIFRARGGFNQKKEKVIMTVLPTSKYYDLRRGIERIDKEAFFIVTDSYELFGGE